jgi:hypothetical protein
MRTTATLKLAVACLFGTLLTAQIALGNGGPFVVKYPSGDPAAKGVLARLEPTLKPAQETRLRVVKEDLTIRFVPEQQYSRYPQMLPPLADVTAAYTIENPTDKEVKIDFGFPILRGIYLLSGMVPYPDVNVKVDRTLAQVTVISNSAIYGIIRRNAAGTIEQGIAADAELARLVADVRNAWIVPQPPAQTANANRAPAAANANALTPPPGMAASEPARKPDRQPADNYPAARENLRKYLIGQLHWNERDAALLVEYVSLDLGHNPLYYPRDGWDARVWGWQREELDKLKRVNFGPLSAIGEQKATQFFAQIASQFDKAAGSTYEAIFSAWGGDVHERALDLATGQLRPREITLPKTAEDTRRPGANGAVPDKRLTADPTVYARVDYLDPNAKLTKEEKSSCEAILRNLPVVFTFAPMNLLHYQVKFAPKSTHTVTVSYRQHAFADTRGSGSYQLAYVLHPATLWKEFGPISLTLSVPEGIDCRATAAVALAGTKQEKQGGNAASGALGDDGQWVRARAMPYRAKRYRATLDKPEEKRGELFVAVDKAAWDKAFALPKAQKVNAAAAQQGRQSQR